MIITQQLLTSGASHSTGGWNRRQLQVIGVDWPPPKGWRELVVGKMISDEEAAIFLDLKGNQGKIRKRQ